MMNTKNKRFLYFALLFFQTCTTLSPAYSQERTATFMTFNIFHGENPYRTGRSNLGDVARIINHYKPDFVALQEVDSMTLRSLTLHQGRKLNLVDELAEMTGMLGFFARAIDFSEGGYGEAVLARAPAEFQSIRLPNPEGGEGRSMALAKIELAGGTKILFAGTHLCHEFEENRNAQVEAIKEILEKEGLPVILAGDFNFGQEETAYSFLSQNFFDAGIRLGNTQNTYSAIEPTIRIDYFWVSKSLLPNLVSLEVLEVDFSDHRPLLLKLRF